MKSVFDFLFGDPKQSYRRARINTTAQPASNVAATLAALDGPASFLLGTLADSTPVRVDPAHIQGHGMVWGANGAGKSYGVEIVMEGYARGANRVSHVDPKGESIVITGIAAASAYVQLGTDEEREAFAARFYVFDVREDRITPSNLFALPPHMSPAFLATLRAAAMVDLSDHAFSDLMHHAVYTLFAVAIALQRGITKKFVRRFFLDDAFRKQVLAPKIADSALRDTVEHLDILLPLPTRQAVVRQYDILLSSRLARISFGLSPAAVARLTSPSTATITLANCGPSLLLPPTVARTQAINHVVDRLTDAKVRTDTTPEMLVIEEIGSIVKHPVVARYLLEGSRTARWKNLAIVCCAQDPSNAIPGEALHALMLNARWFMAFESGREDASLLLPLLPPTIGKADAQRRQSFLAEMATLPPQHCYFVRKGLTPLRVRTRDLRPLAGYSRDELLAIFDEKIARRSMVRNEDAERLIAEEERDLLGGVIPPGSPQNASRAAEPPIGSVEELFRLLDRKSAKGGPQK
jgi:hypothetical protein